MKKRFPFTEEEDFIIKHLIKLMVDDWESISEQLPGRTPKQIRDRYINYLKDGLKNEPWTKEEDDILIDLFIKMGPKWSKMMPSLPGRSSNDIKNRWHKRLFKKFMLYNMSNNTQYVATPDNFQNNIYYISSNNTYNSTYNNTSNNTYNNKSNNTYHNTSNNTYNNKSNNTYNNKSNNTYNNVSNNIYNNTFNNTYNNTSNNTFNNTNNSNIYNNTSNNTYNNSSNNYTYNTNHNTKICNNESTNLSNINQLNKIHIKSIRYVEPIIFKSKKQNEMELQHHIQLETQLLEGENKINTNSEQIIENKIENQINDSILSSNDICSIIDAAFPTLDSNSKIDDHDRNKSTDDFITPSFNYNFNFPEPIRDFNSSNLDISWDL